jgi:hypothetical protein
MGSNGGYFANENDGDQSRGDKSFIEMFEWKTYNHQAEAEQILMAAKLHGAEGCPRRHLARAKSDVLDEKEFNTVRMQIVSNPQTPPVVLDYLAPNASSDIQERIAEHPHVWARTLDLLACLGDDAVRAAVAENPNTNDLTLDMLSRDESADVRYRLAENPHLSPALVTKLRDDSNPYVAYRAQVTMARLELGTAQVIDGAFQQRPKNLLAGRAARR